jgi:hypothetical protein
MEVVFGPGGDVKMSDVLFAFIEPYRPYADTDETFRKLIAVAVVAWNAALYPEDERQDRLEPILQATLPADEPARQEFKAVVNELIARKQKHFSEYRRMILDYELTDTGSGYHLSVASLLEDILPGDFE